MKVSKHWSLAIPFLGLLLIPTQTHTTAPAPVSPYQTYAFRKAFFDAARIYGRAGCGDMNLAELTAKHAIRTSVPANLVASIVATESTCNPLAISNRGAVGLTQVNVKVWSSQYQNFTTTNLLNPEDSMRVGTDIMAVMIKTYGLQAGVSHYNGSGPDADAYAVRVLALAGR